MTDTSTLFRPATMGALELPNRILMAPLTRNRAHPDGTPWEVAQTYYGQRAGAGLIVSEATQITPRGKGYINTPGMHTDAHEAAWKKITDAVHAKGGRMVLQLWHVGRISHVSLQPDGQAPQAPSAINAGVQTFTENGFEDVSDPEAMSTDEIAETVAAFRDGAERAMRAGFDAVEIHGANGYLLDQFLQDGSNKREDEYGGPIENRLRFVREIIDAVATVVPRERIGIRLSPLGQANGISDSDTEATFGAAYEMIAQAGLAYLHVVEEFYGSNSSDDEVEMLKRLRARYDGFYISNGGYDGARAAEAIESGHADAVTIGRPFIANPDLPERIRVDAALNPQDEDTFYGGDERGYTDYPFLDTAHRT